MPHFQSPLQRTLCSSGDNWAANDGNTMCNHVVWTPVRLPVPLLLLGAAHESPCVLEMVRHADVARMADPTPTPTRSPEERWTPVRGITAVHVTQTTPPRRGAALLRLDPVFTGGMCS